MIEDLQLTNFGAGELSPRLKGRTDLAKYYDGCEAMLNMVPMPQGGATRRPGTRYVANNADQTNPPRLVRFVFSTTQPYVLELFGGGGRIYANDGQVQTGGSPVQIALPYTAGDIGALGYTQSADTLFLTHKLYPPRQIGRTSNTAWTTGTLTFLDGPYQDQNSALTTLTPSGPSGSITVTASAITGINNGVGFQPGDVGRLLRMKQSGLWAWMIITAVADTTHVTATVQPAVSNGAWEALDGDAYKANYTYPTFVIVATGGNLYQATTGGTTGAASAPTTMDTTGIDDGTVVWKFITNNISATRQWRLGKWNANNPAQCMFWQNRFCLGGTGAQVNALECSVTGDFYNFAPSQSDGTVTAVNALSWVLDDDEVNAILWLSPAGSAQAMQLGIGTQGGEQILQGAATGAALTPTSVQAYRETQFGSAPNVRPTRVGKSILFFNRPGRKLHEWTFQWQVNGYVGPDLAVLAEHITRGTDGSGVVQVAWQQNPHGVLWAIRGDGALIGLTYLRDQDIVAWHRHQLGGNYYGGPPVVESIACIPSPDLSYDELWLSVLRTVNGTPVRFVEVMTRYFEAQPTEQAWFVDAGLSGVLPKPAATLTPSGFINSAGPLMTPAFTGTATLNASAPIFSAGSVNQLVRLNGGLLWVTANPSTRSVTAQVILPMRSLAPAPSGTWTIAPKQNTLSGLSHLTGEAVVALGDGFEFGTLPVSGGSITLPGQGASLVTAGLPSTPLLLTMPWEPQKAAAASTQGVLKRVDTVQARFFETIGGSYGVRQVDPMTFFVTDKTHDVLARAAANAMDQPVPPLSGIRQLRMPGSHDREMQMLFTQSPCLPLTLLGIHARADVELTADPRQ